MSSRPMLLVDLLTLAKRVVASASSRKGSCPSFAFFVRYLLDD